MSTTVFDVLNKQMQELQTSAETFLSKGSVKDYSEYREVVGLIRGLEQSRYLVQEMANNYGEEE